MILKHRMINVKGKCLLCDNKLSDKIHKPDSFGHLKILDLGCGGEKYKTEAFFPGAKVVGVDFIKSRGVDYVCNFERERLPLSNDTFDMVIARHILEHLSDTVRIMNDLHRVCRKNAVIFIRVPHYMSMGMWQDITHKKGFSYYTFDTLCSYTNNKFKIVEKRLLYFHLNSRRKKRYFLVDVIGKTIEYIANLNPWFYESILCHYLPQMSEIMLKIEVIK